MQCLEGESYIEIDFRCKESKHIREDVFDAWKWLDFFSIGSPATASGPCSLPFHQEAELQRACGPGTCGAGPVLGPGFCVCRKAPGDAWYEGGTQVCSYVAAAEMTPGSLQGG